MLADPARGGGVVEGKAVSILPKHFFRFRSWQATGKNHTRELLEDAAFYCPLPQEFDDPHDSQLGAHATGSNLDINRWLILDMNGIPELIRKHKLSGPTQLNEEILTDPKDKEVYVAAVRRYARLKTRVLCLSSEWTNELMWAFYADNHRGLCLCFNSEHEFFQNAKPVLYTHSPVDVEHMVDSQAEIDHMAYCKSLAWQFQKEWRVVFPGDEPKKVLFQRESLTAVILGYRFPEPHIDSLKQVLINGGYTVELLRVERIPRTYEFGLTHIGKIGPTESPCSGPAK